MSGDIDRGAPDATSIDGRGAEATQVMRTPASSLLGAALSYARAGWPVFPCDSNKRPMTPHGFLDASLNPERIARFWRQVPDARIGLPMRDGFVVVDVDDVEAFEELERRGLSLPTTLMAATPRGQHLWYRTHRPVSPRAGLIPHVDLRGPGSYVIVPPSPGYRWLVVPEVIPYGLD